MMNRKSQSGLTITGLIFWGVIISLVAVGGMKVTPSVIEYYKLLKDIKSTASASKADSTVADVRKTFEKYAEIDSLEFSPSDLDITKENGQIVISFDYEKKVQLFGNVSLLINYKGTTSGATKE